MPPEKGRKPRINLNFRYIIPGTPDAERGQHTYYKYMVHGDNLRAPSVTYAQVETRSMDLFLEEGTVTMIGACLFVSIRF